MRLFEVAEINTGVVFSRINGLLPAAVYAGVQFEADIKALGSSAAQTLINTVQQTELAAARKNFTELKDGYVLNSGDVVFSQSAQKMAIVQPQHAGMLISANFIRLVFNQELFDPLYFVYLYNEDTQFAKQLLRTRQQSNLLERLTTESLKQLELPATALETQQQIAAIYGKNVQIAQQLEHQKSLLKVLEKTVIAMTKATAVASTAVAVTAAASTDTNAGVAAAAAAAYASSAATVADSQLQTASSKQQDTSAKQV